MIGRSTNTTKGPARMCGTFYVIVLSNSILLSDFCVLSPSFPEDYPRFPHNSPRFIGDTSGKSNLIEHRVMYSVKVQKYDKCQCFEKYTRLFCPLNLSRVSGLVYLIPHDK